jgi:hypothetical protein
MVKKIIDAFSRRSFLQFTTLMGLSLGIFPNFSVSWASVAELFNRIRGRLMPAPKSLPESARGLVGLPSEGTEIPLETALNSRCTSDSDGDPKVFHWGMFDLFTKLRPEDIQKIVDGARIPTVTGRAAEVLVSGNELTFRIEKASSAIQKDWLMVASGMQQQAVCLACAALGAGMIFRNMGKDGTETSDGHIATVKMHVDAMKPSYGDSFWTTDAPGEPWLKGNLPEPDRKGHRPLLQALAGLNLKHSGHAPVAEGSVGQVLWAARGRTPHLYKSRHCGMTIPTWAGEQRISGVYLIRKGNLFEYINESRGKPTHSIEPRDVARADSASEIQEKFNASEGLLVIARNEDFARAYWEVGYHLLNAVLQAAALDLSYQAILLDEPQKALIESAGIRTPVAAMALRKV